MYYLRYSLLIILMLAFSNLAVAQDESSLELSTTVEVSQMENETRVMMEGLITEQTGDDLYMFEDETGEITIEVNDDTWRGQDVNEEIKVRVVGIFQKEEDQEKVEVQRLEIIDL